MVLSIKEKRDDFINRLIQEKFDPLTIDIK